MGCSQTTEAENEQGDEEEQFVWYISLNYDKGYPQLKTQRVFSLCLQDGSLASSLQYKLDPCSFGWGRLHASLLVVSWVSGPRLAGLDGNKSFLWLGTVFCTFYRSHCFKSCSHVSFSVYTGILIHASLLIIPVLLFLSQIFMKPLPFYRASVLLWTLKPVIDWPISVGNVRVFPGARITFGGQILLFSAIPGPGHCTCGLWQRSVTWEAPRVAFVAHFVVVKF